MHLKRAVRMFLVVTALATPVACGIDLLATGDGDAVPDASGVDGQAPGADHVPDASDDGTQYLIPPSGDPISDSGLDVNNANCLATCPEGGAASCDAGWCVFDCTTDDSCSDRVACPPGIPCDVRCGGKSSCAKGVDCTTGSACRIACTGESSCYTQDVECSGLGCQLDCIGKGACHQGVKCDASTCAINCIGDDACHFNQTQCSGESCTIRCGSANVKAPNPPCDHDVICDATKLCDIGCVGDGTCPNDPILAHAAVARVQCTGDDTCSNGAVLGGGDASILCSGNNSCGMKTYCDAGACAAVCDHSDVTFCCTSNTCNETRNNCMVKDAGCPN